MTHSEARRMSSESQLREDICRLGRSLFERGSRPAPPAMLSVRAWMMAAGW